MLGHSNCGAILATLDSLHRQQRASPGLRVIVERIRPAPLLLVEAPFRL